ncbi:MAG: MBL fold metallo-hydrolase [Candidatus Poribacteria bacterium]|nr:MBL fold metallo-hydrolase [Candidatus Poribacteria bacterium]
MIFQPLGGASEVGASSALSNIDGYPILVDAGIRMNHEHTNGSPLPDFSVFDKVGMPDAVLLTHAHTDHTGALPDLHKWLPADVKIYCTEATKAIIEVLLKDSIKIMHQKEEQTGEAPRYTPGDVAAVLKRIETVPWSDPVEICPSVIARWTRAGHILGAAMIYIEGKSETLLMTGDVSVTKQLTIPSVDVPAWCCKPDVMVIESTYGNRPHKFNRREEEKRLAAAVANTVIKEEAIVLIPVFAIGRSQEVILILKQAMESEQIPKFPVYVDGMVRDVNAIYSGFADELQRPLRRKAEQGESLFYSDVIEEVPRNYKPEDVLAGGPCCIVASSGMLNGGKSIVYAKQLVANPRNLIAITGYQAEGTPGRALEDLRERKNSEDRVWFLDGERFDVKCRVERYSLSAHADKNELIDLVRKVRPREKLFLVHGVTEARRALFGSARKQLEVSVKLPENGGTYLIKKRLGIASGRRHTMERILSEVHAHLLKMRNKGPFHVRELAAFWFGSEAITAVVVKFVEWCLSLDREFFRRGSDDLFYLR